MNDDLKAGLTVILILTLFAGVLAGALIGKASHNAMLYNGRFGTAYTTSDFLFAGRTIEKFYDQSVPERPATNVINAEVKLTK